MISRTFVCVALVLVAGCSAVTDFDRFHAPDGGGMDARAADGGGGDDAGTCTDPTTEICNGEDDDCNGAVDESFDTDTDPMNCGSCGHVCESRDHGTPECSGGACVHACDPGFGDCDGDYETGCETDLGDPDTCGDCDTVCDTGMACSASEGCVTDCAGGETICGRSCIDTDTSLLHCGACDSPCVDRANSSVACASGACEYTCDTGFDDCDGMPDNGCETDLSTLTDCGSCGNACDYANATGACVAGACMLMACNTGFDDCNATASDGCEADLASTTTCGDCATTCTAPANGSTACSAGACTFACDTGFDNCNAMASDGCEADLSTAATCGTCARACSGGTPVCSMGSCVSGCATGETFCPADSACANLTTDPSHCGSCTTVCPDRPNSSPTCSSSACGIMCDAGFANCNAMGSDGCEASLSTLTNCGSCGAPCALPHATMSCSTGTCTFVSCNVGWESCDGDPTNGCEENTALNRWYGDNDGDGYGNATNSATGGCSPPAGYVRDDTDCNDAEPRVHPGAAEVCNRVDDDCDSITDDGVGLLTANVRLESISAASSPIAVSWSDLTKEWAVVYPVDTGGITDNLRMVRIAADRTVVAVTTLVSSGRNYTMDVGWSGTFWVVAYVGEDPASGGRAGYVQQVGPTGALVGAARPFPASPSSSSGPTNPRIARLNDGSSRVAVSWLEKQLTSSSNNTVPVWIVGTASSGPISGAYINTRVASEAVGVPAIVGTASDVLEVAVPSGTSVWLYDYDPSLGTAVMRQIMTDTGDELFLDLDYDPGTGHAMLSWTEATSVRWSHFDPADTVTTVPEYTLPSGNNRAFVGWAMDRAYTLVYGHTSSGANSVYRRYADGASSPPGPPIPPDVALGAQETGDMVGVPTTDNRAGVASVVAGTPYLRVVYCAP